MDAPSSTDIFLFDRFRLDRRIRTLSRSDKHGFFAPLAISSRALDILGVLVERPGDLVLRAEIFSAVWPDTVVEHSNLNVQIAGLRRVLDEGRTEGSCIQTIPGRGYRFAVRVTRVQPGPPASGHLSGNGAAGPIAEPKLPKPPNPRAASGSGNTPRIIASRERKWLWCGSLGVVAGAVFLLVAVVTASSWRLPWPSEARPVPRLSIVVLPFTALGDDHNAQNLADGLTEDLTTDLSLLPDIRVTSSRTAFTYENSLVDTKQIGHELGVRYLVEGSIQRSGNRLRVNAQLIDAETDTQLWAARFDRDSGDLFALQNQIASQLATTLDIALVAAEAGRQTEHPGALDYLLRGRATRLKPNSPEVFAEAIDAFEHALALDPQSVEVQSRLAGNLVTRVLDGMTNTAKSDLARAGALVDQALAASPHSAHAHFVKGQLLRAQHRWPEAIPEFEMVLSVNPDDTEALHALGECKLYTGAIDEVLPLEERALRLNPVDPHNGYKYNRIGVVHLLQSHTDRAILWLEKAVRGEPKFYTPHAWLASAYALNGETGRAAGELAEARRLAGGDSFSTVARLQVTYSDRPKIRALVEATYFAGLHKAGIPEN